MRSFQQIDRASFENGERLKRTFLILLFTFFDVLSSAKVFAYAKFLEGYYQKPIDWRYLYKAYNVLYNSNLKATFCKLDGIDILSSLKNIDIRENDLEKNT